MCSLSLSRCSECSSLKCMHTLCVCMSPRICAQPYCTSFVYARFHCVSNDDIRNGKMAKTIVCCGWSVFGSLVLAQSLARSPSIARSPFLFCLFLYFYLWSLICRPVLSFSETIRKRLCAILGKITNNHTNNNHHIANTENASRYCCHCF